VSRSSREVAGTGWQQYRLGLALTDE
jgi:hypothetical protein